MGRSIRFGACLAALASLTAFSGCPAEYAELEVPLTVTGTVTYQGVPVKMGAIHFLPIAAGGTPASGQITDGEIKDVFTRAPGDGIEPGKYRIAITEFTKEFLDTAANRDYQGPDMKDVTEGYMILNSGKLLPQKYANAQLSGLVEEFSPAHHRIDLKLGD